ncbi:DUF2306 domain-containing protein [Haloferax larsenii]|uniref:Predicted membrane protein n=1 Tax=Haloferax larsenii TaxID=302484 RepID=A0A1H7PWC3_HALLR|nr:DUF2306 domain-containing protein [Haloferax larsenii]SEL39899.1 Predicted membrane protein [Haloferax larsenii]
MSLIEDATLGIHIVAGFTALFAGLGAIATKKGGRRHRRAGRIYVLGMAVVAVTSLVLFVIEPDLGRTFLALLAVFSYYFVFSGDRVLSRKRPADTPQRLDWIAVGLLTLSGVGLLGLGWYFLTNGSEFGTIMLVFGALAVGAGVQDIRKFRSEESTPREWFYEHISRMGTAYIATVTAFSAVNFDFFPVVAAWLWPTFLGTPLIYFTIRKYKRQTRSRASPTAD